MKIKQVLWAHRNDFYADYECEHCGNILKNHQGYNDSFFHNEVIPNVVCEKCNKNSFGETKEERLALGKPLEKLYK